MPFFIQSLWKIIKITIFLETCMFPQKNSWLLECNSDNAAKKIQENSEHLGSKSNKIYETKHKTGKI